MKSFSKAVKVRRGTILKRNSFSGVYPGNFLCSYLPNTAKRLLPACYFYKNAGKPDTHCRRKETLKE